MAPSFIEPYDIYGPLNNRYAAHLKSNEGKYHRAFSHIIMVFGKVCHEENSRRLIVVIYEDRCIL